MKEVYCAECGERVEVIQKAVPSLGKVFSLVQPHNCLPTDRCEFYPLPGSEEGVCLAGSEVGNEHTCTSEEGRFCEWAIDRRKDKEFKPIEKEKKTLTALDKVFDKFKFVQKLNGLASESQSKMKGEVTDNRDKEHLRKELASPVPSGILNAVRSASNSVPENDVGVEPEEE